MTSHTQRITTSYTCSVMRGQAVLISKEAIICLSVHQCNYWDATALSNILPHPSPTPHPSHTAHKYENKIKQDTFYSFSLPFFRAKEKTVLTPCSNILNITLHILLVSLGQIFFMHQNVRGKKINFKCLMSFIVQSPLAWYLNLAHCFKKKKERYKNIVKTSSLNTFIINSNIA